MVISFTNIIISDEQQVINYQTQQYRLFPALAATYAFQFAGNTFRQILLTIQKEAANFKNVSSKDLAKVAKKYLKIFIRFWKKFMF